MKYFYELQGSDLNYFPLAALRSAVNGINHEKYEKDNGGGGGSPKTPPDYYDWFTVWEEFLERLSSMLITHKKREKVSL